MSKWTHDERDKATWDAGKLCAAMSGTVESRLVETTIELACQRNALLSSLQSALREFEYIDADEMSHAEKRVIAILNSAIAKVSQ